MDRLRPFTSLGISPARPTWLDASGCARHLVLLVVPFQDRVKASADTPSHSSRRAPHKRGFFVFRAVRRYRRIASCWPFVSVFA